MLLMTQLFNIFSSTANIPAEMIKSVKIFTENTYNSRRCSGVFAGRGRNLVQVN